MELPVAPWLFPAFFLLTWVLWGFAVLVDLAARDYINGVPIEKRHGASLFPVIPLFPLAAWAMAVYIDKLISPWGSLLVAAVHAILSVAFIVSVVRNWRNACAYTK